MLIIRGKQVLYDILNKAVYGTLLGGILFYEKLTNQLYKWDYQINPYYDMCTKRRLRRSILNSEQKHKS